MELNHGDGLGGSDRRARTRETLVVDVYLNEKEGPVMANAHTLFPKRCVLWLFLMGLACAHVPSNSSEALPSDRIAFAGSSPSARTEHPASTSARINERYGNLPLSFEANTGQTVSQVDFVVAWKGLYAVLGRSRGGARIARRRPTRGDGRPGQEQLPGKVNYFRGKYPKEWRTNIPTFGKVTYQDLYAGIDLVYYGNQ